MTTTSGHLTTSECLEELTLHIDEVHARDLMELAQEHGEAITSRNDDIALKLIADDDAQVWLIVVYEHAGEVPSGPIRLSGTQR